MMITLKDLENWFEYHAPSADDITKYGLLRHHGYMLAKTMLHLCPEGADRNLAIQKIREAIMMANSAIACKTPIDAKPKMPDALTQEELEKRLREVF